MSAFLNPYWVFFSPTSPSPLFFPSPLRISAPPPPEFSLLLIFSPSPFVFLYPKKIKTSSPKTLFFLGGGGGGGGGSTLWGALNWVKEKLDRALASDEWHKTFDTTSVLNVDAPPSDHTTILLTLNNTMTHRKHRFRFENSWHREDDCREVVQKFWGAAGDVDIQERIKIYGKELES